MRWLTIKVLYDIIFFLAFLFDSSYLSTRMFLDVPVPLWQYIDISRSYDNL